jgi:hypothetical protein
MLRMLFLIRLESGGRHARLLSGVHLIMPVLFVLADCFVPTCTGKVSIDIKAQSSAPLVSDKLIDGLRQRENVLRAHISTDQWSEA